MIVKKIWFTLQIVIICIVCYSLIIRGDRDGDIFFFLSENILTFPSSLLVASLNYFISRSPIMNSYHSFELLYIFINWVLFNIVGYVQWFLIVPAIRKKFTNKP